MSDFPMEHPPAGIGQPGGRLSAGELDPYSVWPPRDTSEDLPRWVPAEGEQMALGEEPPRTPGPEGEAAGRRRGEAGMAVAAAATWSPWRRRFEDALAELAASGREFVSDDVLAICGEPVASSCKSVGALVNAAARSGLIERVDYRTSRRPSRNGSVIAVWRGAS